MINIKNPNWLIFLIVIGAVVFWFTAKAIYLSLNEAQLKEAVSVQSIHWSVKALTEEQYQIEADYTFFLKNKLYHNKTLFTKPLYRNPFAAEGAIQSFSKQQWKVWYNPSNPDHSTLEKTFPLKDWIYVGILWALFCYFIWLGKSVYYQNSK